MHAVSLRPSSTFLILLLLACGEDPASGPALRESVEFATDPIQLGEAGTGAVLIENTGETTLGPIHIVAGPVRRAGTETPGVAVVASPAEVASLAPGSSVTVDLAVEGAGALASGSYTAVLEARLADRAIATTLVRFSVAGGGFSLAGRGEVTDRFTSDLWVHGGVAYTGTWGHRLPGGAGNTVYSWDVSGTEIVLLDSVTVDAGTVNDVKVSADGRFAVVTQEGSASANYGFTVLDLADPAHPQAVSSFIADGDAGSWHGIHNVWIDGTHVYAAVDGEAPDRGLWVFDVSDLENPIRVARFWGGQDCPGVCSLHDVYVRAGLAFLSHWDAGLVILDVGNGIRGGTPAAPVEVGRIRTAGGQTHNAWYWPERALVFVGEEDFTTPGRMHVVDVADLTQPVEVASFGVPGDTPHNFWLDEANAVLYMAWYSEGLIALDVSGPLAGSLEEQDRVIAQHVYDVTGECPGRFGVCTWAPQLHQGRIFVSDMNTGLWAFEPEF